jgi:hypothetical protein
VIAGSKKSQEMRPIFALARGARGARGTSGFTDRFRRASALPRNHRRHDCSMLSEWHSGGELSTTVMDKAADC